MRPDIPPHLFDAFDGPRPLQGVHVLLELGPVRQHVRRSGRRQRAKNDGPTGGESGVLPAPVRAGGRQREEMRQVGRKCVDDGDDFIPFPYPHVDMYAKCLDPPCQPLHLLDQLGVPLDGCVDRLAPVADGVRPRAGQGHAPRLDHLADVVDGRLEVLHGLGRRVAHVGDHFELRLHQLVHDLRARALTQLGDGLQDLARVLAEPAGVRVDKLEFPFDAQRRAARRIELNCHGTPPWALVSGRVSAA